MVIPELCHTHERVYSKHISLLEIALVDSVIPSLCLINNHSANEFFGLLTTGFISNTLVWVPCVGYVYVNIGHLQRFHLYSPKTLAVLNGVRKWKARCTHKDFTPVTLWGSSLCAYMHMYGSVPPCKCES